MRKKFRYYFLAGIVSSILIVALAFILYEYSTELRKYKIYLFGARQDYKKLRNEYDAFVTKTKDLRSITVLTNNPSSKNILVGKIMDEYANKINGDISLYYKNLTTNESVVIDENKTYYMASLYKIILTLFVLEGVKKGTINFEDRIGTSSATVQQGIDKIITESNNEYAQILAETYGWKIIETTIRSRLGIDFSFNKDMEITAKNVGILLEQIALSINISDIEGKYLLLLLNEQKKTSKLPKYLPENIYSHNKTGEFGEFSHDAGIFYTPKANYILIFMSKTKSPYNTNEQMALMSKEVYGVLNN